MTDRLLTNKANGVGQIELSVMFVRMCVLNNQGKVVYAEVLL